MIARVTSHWWLFLIRGLLALALGLVMPWYPGAAILAVAILVGAYCFIDGIVAIATAIRMHHGDGAWIWLVLEGLLGIAVGVITFFYPGLTILSLAFVLGAWAIVTGVLGLASAIRLRGAVPNEWWWVLSSALSIVFGIVVFWAPVFGLLFIVWMISIYAILAGIFFIGLAFRLRSHAPVAGGTTTPT